MLTAWLPNAPLTLCPLSSRLCAPQDDRCERLGRRRFSFRRRRLYSLWHKPENGSEHEKSPIGCVIVLDGFILAEARNRVADDRDATAHAEMIAIRKAGRAFKDGELRGATLYTTLQPCGMCTMASIWSRVGRVVYGAGKGDVHRMCFEARHVDTLNFIRKAYREDATIDGGLLRDECRSLYFGPNDHPPVYDQGNL